MLSPTCMVKHHSWALVPERFVQTGRRRFLHHFYINTDAGRQVYVRQRLDDLRRGVQDVYHAFVNAHLELLAGVFVDECGAIDGVFPYVDGQGHRADDRGIVAGRRVDYLLHGFVEDAVLVRTYLDAETVRCFSLFWCACRSGSGGNGRIDCRFSSKFNSPRAWLHCPCSPPLLYRLLRCHRTRRVCTILSSLAMAVLRTIVFERNRAKGA